jgi:hypothetical protein
VGGIGVVELLVMGACCAGILALAAGAIVLATRSKRREP